MFVSIVFLWLEKWVNPKTNSLVHSGEQFRSTTHSRWFGARSSPTDSVVTHRKP